MGSKVFKPIKKRKRRKSVYKMFMDGEWTESKTGETFRISNPANGKTIGYGQAGNIDDARKAVKAAYGAKDEISEMRAVHRAAILQKTGELILEHKDEIVDMIVAESGKPVSVTEGEVKAAAERLFYSSEECKEIYGEEITGDLSPHKFDKFAMVIRQPVGTVLAVSPFNYPLHIAVCKIAPAIAAGNSVICKPASKNPVCMLMLARLMEVAGIPRGAFNVITGSGSGIGDYLVNHPKINMISFTGSTSVGKHIAQICGMKKIHLELGGKAPAIVLKDCDMDLAVKECLKGALTFSGQRCDAISRILIEDDIADKFVRKVLKELKNWKMGDPRKKKTMIGPLISKSAVEKVDKLVQDAIRWGAKLLKGGRYEDLFYEPTVLDNVTPKMKIAWEETFGPVVTIIRVKNYEEAISLANESDYGLDASIFTKDIDKALDAGLRLEDGTVSINASPSHGLGLFPFGGDKDSGIGREGIRHSLQEMTKVHTIIFKKNKPGK